MRTSSPEEPGLKRTFLTIGHYHIAERSSLHRHITIVKKRKNVGMLKRGYSSGLTQEEAVNIIRCQRTWVRHPITFDYLDSNLSHYGGIFCKVNFTRAASPQQMQKTISPKL